jgi:diguanylate cyclase (GGDEF)-like protein
LQRDAYRAAATALVVLDAQGLVLDCNIAAEVLLGATRETLTGRPLIGPEHPLGGSLEALEAGTRTSLSALDGTRMLAAQLSAQGPEPWRVLTLSDLTAEENELERLRLRDRDWETLDRIAQAVDRGANLETAMWAAVCELRRSFTADRAWLLHPCDPGADSYRVPLEDTAKGFAGAYAAEEAVAITPEAMEIFTQALRSEVPLTVYADPHSARAPSFARAYCIHAQMHVCLRLPEGRPWLLGLHHCRGPRSWTRDEQRLFGACARSLEAGFRRHAALEALTHQAHHDPLTELPNRRLCTDRLDQALKRARRAGTEVALIGLDLDGFKAVNDRLGHPAGDELLRQVSRRLLEAVREEDTVARVGGDEFEIILADLRHSQLADAVANRINEFLSRPFEIGGESLRISASLGLALGPDEGETPAELEQAADAALYRVKHAAHAESSDLA